MYEDARRKWAESEWNQAKVYMRVAKDREFPKDSDWWKQMSLRSMRLAIKWRDQSDEEVFGHG